MTDLRDQLRTYFDALTDDVLADAVALAPAPGRGARPRRTWIGVAAAIVVALVAAYLVVRDGSGSDRVHVAGIGRTVVQLVGYGDGTDYDDLAFADPDTGATRRIAINGSCFCQPVIVDGTVWGSDDQSVFRVDLPYDKLTRVNAERGTLFPTLDGTGIWVASGRIGAVSVRRIDAKTNEVGPRISLPAGSLVTDHPASEVVGGILIFGDGYPRSLSIWNPDTGAVRELVANAGNLGATHTAPGAHSSQVIFRDAQQALHILDTASGRSIPITVNGETARGIGGGAFSPDGKTIAAFVNVSTSDVGGVAGGRIAQLMLVDAATGAGRVIDHDPVEFGEEYGWATWAPDGSRVFFGAGGPAYGVGLHETNATPLAVASNYTWTALDVPAPATTEPAPAPVLAASVTATWTRLDAAPDLFPNGAEVQSVVEFGNRLIAAGAVYGTTPVGVANPVVWTSTNGGPWQRTWDAGAIVGGSSSIPHLTVLGDSVWILHAGTGGSTSWRSTDGLTWEPVELPELMRGTSVYDAAERDGVLVAVAFDKMGRGNVLWRSADDGTTWEQLGSALGVDAVPSSIVATDRGFVVAGLDTASGTPTVWTSADSRGWNATHLSTKQGRVASLAVLPDGTTVVEGTADNQPTSWYRSGDSWIPADSYRATSVTVAPNARLQALRTGIVSLDARPDAVRYSRDGKTWLDVVSTNAPSGTVGVGGPSGDSLVVFVSETNAAGASVLHPYRVDFR